MGAYSVNRESKGSFIEVVCLSPPKRHTIAFLCNFCIIFAITKISFLANKFASQSKNCQTFCFNLIHTNHLVIKKPCEYEVFCQSLIKHYTPPFYFLCYILDI